MGEESVNGGVKLSFGKQVETKDKKYLGEEVASSTDTKTIEAGAHEEPWAKVEINLDARIGKPNYSSVGVGVRLTMPCHPNRVDETFEKVKAWCEERMGELTKEVS